MTRPPIFRISDWTSTSTGVWEARACPDRTGVDP